MKIFDEQLKAKRNGIHQTRNSQPPSVTALWQHCRGGLQAWCVWSVGLAATVAQIANMDVSVVTYSTTFVSVVTYSTTFVSVVTYSTTFRSSKVRPLRCFETSGSEYWLTQRHTQEERDLHAPPYLVDVWLTHLRTRHGDILWRRNLMDF
jgi:hypothetical protein